MAKKKNQKFDVVSLQNVNIPSSSEDIQLVMNNYYDGSPEDKNIREALTNIASCMEEIKNKKHSKYLKKIPIIGNYLVEKEKEMRKEMLVSKKDIVKELSYGLEKNRLKLIDDNIILGKLIEKVDKTISEKKEMIKEFEEQLEEYKNYENEEVNENTIYALNQVIMDTQQILLTEENSRVTIETLMMNNFQLSNNIKRVTEVTCQSLASSLLIESQLEQQKKLLNLTNTINKETSNLIASSSEKLKNQGVDIQEQSMNQLLDQEALEKAMTNCLEALNQVRNFKENAIPKMEAHIEKTRSLLLNVDNIRGQFDAIECEVEER